MRYDLQILWGGLRWGRKQIGNSSLYFFMLPKLLTWSLYIFPCYKVALSNDQLQWSPLFKIEAWFPTIKLTSQSVKLNGVSVFTRLCNHYHEFQNVFVSPKVIPLSTQEQSLYTHPSSSPWQPLINFPHLRTFHKMESYSVRHFVSGFFHIVKCCQDLSALWHISVLPSFSLLNNIP